MAIGMAGEKVEASDAGLDSAASLAGNKFTLTVLRRHHPGICAL